MAISCDTNDLMAAARCYRCIPKGQQIEVLTYLMAVIAGGSLDPNELMAEAKCFRCIPEGMQLEIQTYLLCQIANKVGA